ncbi:hypothetical protein BE20_58775 [Sorangium cellulosum]|uniref:hypothetical protein n=1 Tax=Sorangium sp. So ce185 TaxID=3133287 RepID=UPI0007797632|nr:hypothetical protein BE20_58775 [Sorangium cellulosum]
MIIRIDKIVIDAPEGADVAALADEVRAGIAASFSEGRAPRAFSQDAPLLRATHTPDPRGAGSAWRGIGEAIAQAAAPRGRP